MKLFRFILVSLLALCLTLSMPLGYANNLATWQQSKTIRQGSTTVYHAVQETAQGLQQGVAKIRPTAQQVAKTIVRTGAVLAVELAIDEILGAVDYVMDPAHNQIRYSRTGDNDKTVIGQGRCSHGIYDVISNKTTEYRGTFGQMQQLACAKHKGNPYHTVSWYVDAPFPLHYKYFHFVCDGGHGANVGIVCEIKGLEESLAFEIIAEQIIKNADAGQEDAIKYVGQVADEIVTQQEKERQWEATKHIVASANANEDTDTSNPDKEKDDKEPKNNDCKNKISDWELKQNGFDAHDLKSIVGSNVQRYELCKCKNKEIVIREKGCKGGIIPTGEFLK